MITNILWYHTAIYYVMTITRDRFWPQWVLSDEDGAKTLYHKNAETEQICHWGQKKMQYKTISYSNTYIMGSHLRTQTNDMDYLQVTSVTINRSAGSLLRLIIL